MLSWSSIQLSLLLVLCNSNLCQMRDYQLELVRHLQNNITDYSPLIRPNLDPNQVVNISFTAMLNQILQVDSARQSVKVVAFMLAQWSEERLVWNPADFGNVTVMDWDANNIWFPVIVMHNGMGDNQLLKPQFPAFLTSVTPNLTTVSASWRQDWDFSCKFDMTRFPIDRHICDAEFFVNDQGRGYKMVLPVKINDLNNELAAYVDNSEWRMINASSFIKRRPYELLRGLPKVPLPTFVMRMEIERVSTYYLINVVTPLLLLTLLQVLVFFVPVESGEKLGFGITIMLSYTVFLLLLEGILPKSQSMPAIASFITTAMILSTTSLLLTSIIIRFHFASDDARMPVCIRAFFVDFLGRVMCVGCSDLRGKTEPDESTDAEPDEDTKKPSDWTLAALAVERLMVILGIVATCVIFGVFIIRPYVLSSQ